MAYSHDGQVAMITVVMNLRCGQENIHCRSDELFTAGVIASVTINAFVLSQNNVF